MVEAAVLESTVEDEKTRLFRGIVMPHHPRTDENALITVYRYREMQRLGLTSLPPVEIVFWGHPDCPANKIDEFIDEGFLPAEIGDTNYRSIFNSKDEPARSATEALMITLGYDSLSLSDGEVMLMEILARRNGHGPKGRDEGGYMNQFHMSLPKILKDVYTLPGYDELDVMNRYQDIVHAYLDFENKTEELSDLAQKVHAYLDYMNTPVTERIGKVEPKLPDELANLVRMTAKCSLAPFTPGRYLRDLCDRDEPVDQIREKVKFWLKALEDSRSEYLKAKSQWPSMEKVRFSFNGLPGAAVATTNSFVSKVCFGKDQPGRVDLLIVQNQNSGHTAILTRKQDTRALYEELERLEPGQWHRHEATGNLLNGGLPYPDVIHTDQSLSELAGLAGKFPPR